MAKIIDILQNYHLKNKTIKIGKIPVAIKTTLSADDYMSCVRTVVDSCFVEDEYKPDYKEIAKRYAYIECFTDIEIGEMNTEQVFRNSQLSWWAEIFDIISALPVFYEIENAIEELIQYRIATRKTAFDNLCDSLSAILDQDNEQNLADMKEIVNKLNTVDKNAFVKAVIDNNIEKNKT